MFLDNLKKDEIDVVIDKLIAETPNVTSKDKDFEKFFILSKENLNVKLDSLYIIEKNLIDNYEDSGESLSGNPLGTIISFGSMDDSSSAKVRLNVKIPDKLEVAYTNRYDDTKKYCIFYIESRSNLFVSNVSEQNVDNTYLAVKSLLDGKFNVTRELNYGEIPLVLSEIANNNSIKNFQMIIYELLCMSLSRNLKDASKEFRFEGKFKSPYTAFQMINVRDIGRNASAFSALASENISKSLFVALKQNKNENKESVLTPQEKIALRKF